MDIKPIKTEEDYRAALETIDLLWDSEEGSSERDRLEVLIILVEDYEEKHHNIPEPDPIEAIQYYMDSRNLSRADLEPYIGSRARVSEILNRKRPLTLRMIRNLEEGFGIPASILVQPYEHSDPSVKPDIPALPVLDLDEKWRTLDSHLVFYSYKKAFEEKLNFFWRNADYHLYKIVQVNSTSREKINDKVEL